MRVELLNSDWAELSFANDSRVSIKGESGDKSSYLVKWHKRSKCNDDYDFVGDMEITRGTWGAYPYEDIEQWKVDFFETEEKQASSFPPEIKKLVASFDNNLANKPVILENGPVMSLLKLSIAILILAHSPFVNLTSGLNGLSKTSLINDFIIEEANCSSTTPLGFVNLFKIDFLESQ